MCRNHGEVNGTHSVFAEWENHAAIGVHHELIGWGHYGPRTGRLRVSDGAAADERGREGTLRLHCIERLVFKHRLVLKHRLLMSHRLCEPRWLLHRLMDARRSGHSGLTGRLRKLPPLEAMSELLSLYGRKRLWKGLLRDP